METRGNLEKLSEGKVHILTRSTTYTLWENNSCIPQVVETYHDMVESAFWQHNAVGHPWADDIYSTQFTELAWQLLGNGRMVERK